MKYVYGCGMYGEGLGNNFFSTGAKAKRYKNESQGHFWEEDYIVRIQLDSCEVLGDMCTCPEDKTCEICEGDPNEEVTCDCGTNSICDICYKC